MPEPLTPALDDIRALLLDSAGLRRAVAAGHRRGQTPAWVQVRLRPVTLKGGPHLQIEAFDGRRPTTRNVPWGAPAAAAVDELLAEPFGNWHVESVEQTVQLRVTKRGEAQVHRAPHDRTQAHPAPHDRTQAHPAPHDRTQANPAPHDQPKVHLVDPGDPLFDVIGGSAAKRRQVDAFLRALAATIDPAALAARPVRVVDLGCGNAYLTFAAYRYLTGLGLDVYLVGVDVRDDQRERNTRLAAELGWSERVRFVAGTIENATIDFPDAGDADTAGTGATGAPQRPRPVVDIALALHACDTATDEALARAIDWRATYVLAAPCCHHDVAAQLRRNQDSGAFHALISQAILRERFADVLTDTLRASLLRQHGYKVEVVEFVDSVHTPRNLLLRARRTGVAPTPEQRAEYAELVAAWRVTPKLAELLGDAAARRPAG